MQRPPSPLSLKFVAWLFILGGVSTALEIFLDLLRARLNVNFGVLGIFIGLGLLRHRPGWRTLGLVFLWLAMIGMPIVLGILLSSSRPTELKFFGRKFDEVSPGLAVLGGLLFFALAIWEYRVLTRPRIRALFYPEPRIPA